MTESEKASEWLRYFKVVPKMSTLRAVEKNSGEKVLERVMRDAGLASPLDVVRACTGDDW
jgi:hypothetical protein